MYINVGMANCVKKDPNKNGMTYASHTLPSLHLFTFKKLFCNMEVCVLLEHVLISYTGVCTTYGCWKQASARWESSESLCWMMPIVEL